MSERHPGHDDLRRAGLAGLWHLPDLDADQRTAIRAAVVGALTSPHGGIQADF